MSCVPIPVTLCRAQPAPCSEPHSRHSMALLLADVPDVQPRGFGRVVARGLRVAVGEIRFTRGPLMPSIAVKRARLFVVLGRVGKVLRRLAVMFDCVV